MMSTEVSFNEEIQNAAMDIDNGCRTCCSGLFFAHNFQPKLPISNANDETQFWYAVTNLYGLFYDCAPYVFQKHKQYQNQEYISQAPETVLEFLTAQALLSTAEKEEIVDFISAVSELRSCFCHNKVKEMFKRRIIEKSLGDHGCQWTVFPHLSNRAGPSFDYAEGLDLLQQKTLRVFALLTSAVSGMAELVSVRRSDSDSENVVPTDKFRPWARAIAAWYLQSNDVRELCLYRRYTLLDKNKRGRIGDTLREWRGSLSRPSMQKELCICEKDFNAHMETVLEGLTLDILASPGRARPEIILKNFFDSAIILKV